MPAELCAERSSQVTLTPACGLRLRPRGSTLQVRACRLAILRSQDVIEASLLEVFEEGWLLSLL